MSLAVAFLLFPHTVFTYCFLFSSLLVLAILVFPRYRSSSSMAKTRHPPSPFKLPIIGNLHQLGPLPHRSLHALSQKHGSIMLLHLGRMPVLVVSSKDMAQEVMRTQDHIFGDRPSLKHPRILLYQGQDVAFAHYGEYWRQAKKLSIIHLLSSKRVKSYQPIREQEVAFMIEKISRLSSHGPINISEMLQSLSKDIISRVALGKSSKDERWSKGIGKLIEETSALIGAFHVGDYFPRLAWLGAITGVDARVKRAFSEADDMFDEIIEDHLTPRNEEHESKAFIDVLLSLEKDRKMEFPLNKVNIKAIIKDMFGAGIDSMYITMEWNIAEIVRNPEVMKKLKDEISEVAGGKATIKEEDLVNMKYLKAVIKETMRLHPPGPLLVPRQLMEDTKIQGYEIPRKTTVLVNVWSIGRDDKIWESPEKFWPERFMGTHVDFYGHDFELTPFGAGRRICPGINFSVPIIELAIANLVHHFDLKLPHGMRGEDLDMMEAPGITARKKINIHVVATPCTY